MILGQWSYLHFINILSQVKDETTFRYAYAGIRTQVVVICGPARSR